MLIDPVRGPAWPWCRTVAVRDATAEDRRCTSLELLFDLCFVASVAALVIGLHDAVVGGHAAGGAWTYAVLFVPVCWAWTSFSWFASAYDNDDVTYRLLTLAQMAGMLAVTAAIPAAFHGTVAPFTLCYVGMRVPLVVKWLRSARGSDGERRYSIRQAAGSTACQGLWLSLAALPPRLFPVLVVLVMLTELTVPWWAGGAARRPVVNIAHLKERFGLFTMIVIGESVIAAAAALHGFDTSRAGPQIVICASTLLAAFSIWWLYFGGTDGEPLAPDRAHTFRWATVHLLAFGAIAAMGASAEIAVAIGSGSSPFGTAARLAIVVPGALSLIGLAWVHALCPGGERFRIVSRIAGAAGVAAAGVASAPAGPAAATAAVAAVLFAQATGETVVHGLRERHTAASAAVRRLSARARNVHAVAGRSVAGRPRAGKAPRSSGRSSPWSRRWAWATEASVT